jgi:hypothetical protein
LTFETRETKVPLMYIFAEPYDEEEIEAIQSGEFIQAVRVAEEKSRAEKELISEAEGAESSVLPTAANDLDNENAESAESDETSEALSGSEMTASESSKVDTGDESLVTENLETESSIMERDEDSLVEDSSSADLDDKLRLPDRDLLVMGLKTRNYIDGNLVTAPPTPNSYDKWEITSKFEEYSLPRAQRLHRMSQERRRKALDYEFREQALEGSARNKKNAYWKRRFVQHLKGLSKAGKVWRDKFEQKWGDKEKVVWREGTPPSLYGDMAWRDQQVQEKPKE